MRISHETIYRSLYVQSRGELRRQLTAQLRSGPLHAQIAQPGRAARPDPGMVSIAQRPPEVDSDASLGTGKAIC